MVGEEGSSWLCLFLPFLGGGAPGTPCEVNSRRLRINPRH